MSTKYGDPINLEQYKKIQVIHLNLMSNFFLALMLQVLVLDMILIQIYG